MKTIFIFDNTRATDTDRKIVALGEDGHIIAHLDFDHLTAPHCRYAMGAEHTFVEHDEALTKEIVSHTRRVLLRRYDEIYGQGNWIPLWLDNPRVSPEWRHAMSLARELAVKVAPLIPTRGFSERALQGIMRDIIAADAVPHGVTKH
ncbi:hypothetical protein [Paraburkholderia largidicola]|uniref:Uncharacterized protein n=1 Tax=Paraburkholderia largidicola TaxID=3014751 RepID=A0A7I8BJP1_9BURK|nr:hypothetical protein [Paraburkholderia sp. PGU16]BCF88715.1 hypothetical protein PPGU16_17820 [Paraburkholderia sp. PGU16]